MPVDYDAYPSPGAIRSSASFQAELKDPAKREKAVATLRAYETEYRSKIAPNQTWYRKKTGEDRGMAASALLNNGRAVDHPTREKLEQDENRRTVDTSNTTTGAVKRTLARGYNQTTVGRAMQGMNGGQPIFDVPDAKSFGGQLAAGAAGIVGDLATFGLSQAAAAAGIERLVATKGAKWVAGQSLPALARLIAGAKSVAPAAATAAAKIVVPAAKAVPGIAVANTLRNAAGESIQSVDDAKQVAKSAALDTLSMSVGNAAGNVLGAVRPAASRLGVVGNYIGEGALDATGQTVTDAMTGRIPEGQFANAFGQNLALGYGMRLPGAFKNYRGDPNAPPAATPDAPQRPDTGTDANAAADVLYPGNRSGRTKAEIQAEAVEVAAALPGAVQSGDASTVNQIQSRIEQLRAEYATAPDARQSQTPQSYLETLPEPGAPKSPIIKPEATITAADPTSVNNMRASNRSTGLVHPDILHRSSEEVEIGGGRRGQRIPTDTGEPAVPEVPTPDVPQVPEARFESAADNEAALAEQARAKADHTLRSGGVHGSTVELPGIGRVTVLGSNIKDAMVRTPDGQTFTVPRQMIYQYGRDHDAGNGGLGQPNLLPPGGPDFDIVGQPYDTGAARQQEAIDKLADTPALPPPSRVFASGEVPETPQRPQTDPMNPQARASEANQRIADLTAQLKGTRKGSPRRRAIAEQLRQAQQDFTFWSKEYVKSAPAVYTPDHPEVARELRARITEAERLYTEAVIRFEDAWESADTMAGKSPQKWGDNDKRDPKNLSAKELRKMAGNTSMAYGEDFRNAIEALIAAREGRKAVRSKTARQEIAEELSSLNRAEADDEHIPDFNDPLPYKNVSGVQERPFTLTGQDAAAVRAAAPEVAAQEAPKAPTGNGAKPKARRRPGQEGSSDVTVLDVAAAAQRAIDGVFGKLMDRLPGGRRGRNLAAGENASALVKEWLGMALTKEKLGAIPGVADNVSGTRQQQIIDAFNWMGKNFVPRFNVGPELQRILDHGQIVAKTAEMRFRELIAKTEGLDIKQRQILDDVLRGKADAPEYRALAAEVRELVNSVADAFEQIGWLNEEARQHNPEYLTTAYAQTELERSWPSKVMGGIGKALNQATMGMFMRKGKTKTYTKSWLDRQPVVGEAHGNPVYRLDDGHDWELRWSSGDHAELWRDYTDSERAEMGYINDGRYNLINTAQKAVTNLENGVIYQELASRPDMAKPAPEAPSRRPRKSDPQSTRQQLEAEWATYNEKVKALKQQGWVQVPDTRIGGGNGPKRFANLAGMWVRSDVAKVISAGNMYMGTGGLDQPFLKQAGRWFKDALGGPVAVGKTALNAATWTNNYIGNTVLSYLQGVNPDTFIMAHMVMLGKGDEWSRLAHEKATAGALFRQGNTLEQDRRGALMDALPIDTEGLTRLEKMVRSQGSTNMPVPMRAVRFFQAVTSMAKDKYSHSDDVFRLALYMQRLRDGVDATTALREAKEGFVNTAEMDADAWRTARDFWNPFVTWTVKAMPVIGDSILRRPDRAVTLLALLAAATGHHPFKDDDEKKERALMNKLHVGTGGPFGVDLKVRTPFSTNGNRLYFDMGRKLPGMTAFDFNERKTLSGLPEFLQPGPVQGAVIGMMGDTNMFGQPLTDPARAPSLNLERQWQFAYDQLMPSAPLDTPAALLRDATGIPLPSGYYGTKIARAIEGREDQKGNSQSPWVAVAQSMGLTLREANVPQMKKRVADELTGAIRQAKTFYRQTAKAVATGALSEAKGQRDMAEQKAHIERLEAEARQFEVTKMLAPDVLQEMVADQ